MTLQQLKYIVALDDYRHYVTAAEKCFVSQSTLSIQVKKLEEHYGILVFERHKQPLKPTKLGEAFIEKARNILRHVDLLNDLVLNEKQEINGEFKMGIIPTLAPYLLPLFMKDFMQQHQSLALQVEETQSSELIAKLVNGRLDMAILATPLNEPDLLELPLFYEPFLLFAHAEEEVLRGNALSADALEPGKLWLLSQGHCFRNQTQNICGVQNAGQGRSLEMAGGSIETLKGVVNSMGGYTLIPELSFLPTTEEAQVKRFAAPEPVREISLVVHRSFMKKRLVEKLQESILAGIPESFQQLGRSRRVKWR